jgi:hypothetical protein
MVMTRNTGVFLPDEQEEQEQSPQSAKPDHGELSKLTEPELKAAIIAAWKKHEELAKQELAPMLYWLRDKLRAQGARNDLTQDKDRGFAFWVEEHLDISRRTADRWCDWYAVKVGYRQDATSGHLSKSDLEMYEDILDTHKGKLQIAFNVWVPKAVHAQYSTALTTLQKKFACKDKKEALVRGVIYAASVINRGRDHSNGRGHSRLVGKTTSSQRPRTAKNFRRSDKAVRHTLAGGRTVQNALRDTKGGSQAKRRKHDTHSTGGHRAGGSSKAMRAAAGQ